MRRTGQHGWCDTEALGFLPQAVGLSRCQCERQPHGTSLSREAWNRPTPAPPPPPPTRPPRGACVAVTPNLVWIAPVGDCVQVLYDRGRSCARGGGRGFGRKSASRRSVIACEAMKRRSSARIGVNSRDPDHRGDEGDNRPLITDPRRGLLSRGSQVRILPGAPLSTESFGKPRVRASVLARHSTSEPLSFRVADRVAGVFAWQTAWQNRHQPRGYDPLGHPSRVS